MLTGFFKNAFVSWQTTLLGVLGFTVANGPQILDYLDYMRGQLAQPNFHWTPFVIGTIIMLQGAVSRDANKPSEAHVLIPMPSLPSPATLKAPLIAFACCATLFMSGCATDARVTAATQAAQKYEQEAISQNAAIHREEQNAFAQASFADIKFRSDLNVAQATAIVKAQPTPDNVVKLAADIQRTYQEAQQQRDAILANIANVNTQISAANAWHTAAQNILDQVNAYNAAPSVTATGVATSAVNALTNSGLVKTKTATVPDATAAPTSTAVSVPGQ